MLKEPQSLVPIFDREIAAFSVSCVYQVVRPGGRVTKNIYIYIYIYI